MPSKPKTKNLTLNELIAVVVALSEFCFDGVLARGAIASTALQFNYRRHTVERVWQRRQESDTASIDPSSRMKETMGRHLKRTDDELIRVIESVSLSKRGTLRTLTAAAKVPQTTLHRLLRRDVLRLCNSRVEPFLMSANKIVRRQFALTMVNPSTMQFDAMYDRVFVDEKWFYLSQVNKRFYLTADEEDVERAVMSKRHIPKVMFISALARPRHDTNNNRQFSGKLGIWPFVVNEPAKRLSKNRPAGALVTNPVNVDKQVYKTALLDHVLPTIKEQWPGRKSTLIVIQQANAKPHIAPTDPDIVAAGPADGWNIRLQFQPPNSPDFDVLDLGFFASIQSIQHRETPSGLDELIACINNAFTELSDDTLDNVFLTLQSVFHETLKTSGDNKYKIPHMGKKKQRKQGPLPVSIMCDEHVYAAALEADSDD